MLLWQKRDIGLLTHFVQQLQDSDERERAWQRYHTLRRFVEQPRCRHRQICLHFGETPKWESCGVVRRLRRHARMDRQEIHIRSTCESCESGGGRGAPSGGGRRVGFAARQIARVAARSG